MIPRQSLKCSVLAAVLSAWSLGAHAEDWIGVIGAGDPAALQVPAVAGPETWKDPSQPLDARVHDLVRRMSLAEKTTQLRADAAALPRLGLPAYSYRNEALHGEARTGIATVFPEPIGMAATWDPPLIRREADVIATEARAKFNDYARSHHGDSAIHWGVSFYAPNLNLFRDPRWGRGQETYGEDPLLIAQFGVAFIRGLQGDDPKYVKAMAGAKHYAVHSGPELGRIHFEAAPPERDLYDTYLPGFEAAVREGHVGSVMGAYSGLFGVPDCANSFLLTDLLRRQWGFDGFVVSDGGAILNLCVEHKYVATPEEAAAAAVKAGCDLFSGKVAGAPRLDYEALGRMLKKGLLSETEIDAAVSRTLAARFRLGLFDPPALVPYSKITMADNDTPEHRALALKVARESIVVLKNDGLLPLDRAWIKRIAVIGPNADSIPALLGNYNGQASHPVTILDGIKQLAGAKIEVTYERGCPLALNNDGSNQPTLETKAQAVAAAESADVVIYVGGIDSSLEREGGGKANYRGFQAGDRTSIELPPVQEDFLRALHATGKPIVLVNCSGSAMAMPWEARELPAMVQAWYPGEEGGRAVAEVLFGDVNPSARLPITLYGSTSDLPAFYDYSMSERTYRYFDGKPLFAFGHGLSYTRFDYAGARLDTITGDTRPPGAPGSPVRQSDARRSPAAFEADETMKLSFTVANTGKRTGDEVAQVYFRQVPTPLGQPKLALCAWARVHLAPGQVTIVTMDIPGRRLRHWSTLQKRYVVEAGAYELLVGAASDDIRMRLPLIVRPSLASSR